MSWVAARGRPNWILSRVYWRAAEKQNSAAPKAPHAIPSLADVKQVNGPYKQVRQANLIFRRYSQIQLQSSVLE